MTDYNDVPVEDDSIKLGQFLKLANLIESGGEAKRVLAGDQRGMHGSARLGWNNVRRE